MKHCISKKRCVALLLIAVLAFSLCVPAYAAGENPEDTVRSLTDRVAERIAAGNETLNAGQEVRIPIDGDVLKKAEVVVNKDDNGLYVTFVTERQKTQEFLNEHIGEIISALKDKLTDVEGIIVSVELVGETLSAFNRGSIWLVIICSLALVALAILTVIHRKNQKTKKAVHPPKKQKKGKK